MTRGEVIRRIEVCLQNAHDDSHHASETGQQLYDPIDQWGACLEALQNALTELTRPAPQPSEGGVELVDAFQRAVSEDEQVAAWEIPPKRATLDRLKLQYNDARDALLARLAATKGAVPEGWQLVPETPTREMMKAARDLETKSAVENYGGAPSGDDYWHAMLSAAPAPEVRG